jgi:phospholipase/carboxylesterase
MPKRRDILFAAATLAFGRLLAACGKKSTRTARDANHGGVDFKVLVPNQGNDDKAPFLVAIPGNGGAPEHWVEPWSKFPGTAQIAIPRGFTKEGEGYAWFPWNKDMKDEKLAADVASAEAQLWKGIEALAAGRKLVIAGYAQGALLTYVMAARHPDRIAGAFPVAGACPEKLLPKDKAKAAPIVAFHGSGDDVITLAADRTTIAAFKAEGNSAELREYAKVGHSPSDELHADLNSEILKALAR